MATIPSGIIRVILLFLLCMMMVPVTAMQPAWIYTDGRAKIEDIAIAPDGSTVVAGTGKVLLLSKDGTVLAKEPFGEILAQSRDGSTIVTAYSSTVSSTVYLFKKTMDTNGNPSLQKKWEETQSTKVGSLTISDNGNLIAFTSGGRGVQALDGTTGKSIGFSENYSSLVAMSGRGTAIAGVSAVEGLNLYSSRGTFIKKFDLPLSGQPDSLLMNTEGDTVIFNTGPYITAFNISKESEVWKKRSSADVNMLAMTPSGNYIAAGTENGAIEFYDANGNLSWTYNTNNGTGSEHAIQAVALTRDGSKIIAGAGNGMILILDSAGGLLGEYSTKKDQIRNIAIAADGSLAAAASENTIYAFSTGQPGTLPNGIVTSSTLPSQTFPSGVSSTTNPDSSDTPQVIRTIPPSVAPRTPTVTQTEYSVVRKTTQSPLDAMAGIAALTFLLFFGFSKNH